MLYVCRCMHDVAYYPCVIGDKSKGAPLLHNEIENILLLTNWFFDSA